MLSPSGQSEAAPEVDFVEGPSYRSLALLIVPLLPLRHVNMLNHTAYDCCMEISVTRTAERHQYGTTSTPNANHPSNAANRQIASRPYSWSHLQGAVTRHRRTSARVHYRYPSRLSHERPPAAHPLRSHAHACWSGVMLQHALTCRSSIAFIMLYRISFFLVLFTLSPISKLSILK